MANWKRRVCVRTVRWKRNAPDLPGGPRACTIEPRFSPLIPAPLPRPPCRGPAEPLSETPLGPRTSPGKAPHSLSSPHRGEVGRGVSRGSKGPARSAGRRWSLSQARRRWRGAPPSRRLAAIHLPIKWGGKACQHKTLHELAPWSDERGAGCTADIVSGFECLVVMPEASRTRRFTRIPCGTVSKPAGTGRSSFLPVSPQMATPEPDAVTHQARTSSARSRAQGTELMPPIPETDDDGKGK